MIAVWVYNNNVGFSTVFVTIRENKENTYRLGAQCPEPIAAAAAVVLVLVGNGQWATGDG